MKLVNYNKNDLSDAPCITRDKLSTQEQLIACDRL